MAKKTVKKSKKMPKPLATGVKKQSSGKARSMRYGD